MRIAYITAGAAGMYCGSCLHDNTLVAALINLGHDAQLIPVYTPLRTDEEDVSQQRVFLGGINVYLQQKFAVFRHVPRLVARLLDAPVLLRWVGRFAVKTRAEDLAELTLSVLRGEHGHQRREIARLARYLRDEVKPEIVNLTNVLLSGLVHELKEKLHVPVLGTLQGDDLFLDFLPEPQRAQALGLIRANCRALDGFIATSAYYADFMAEYLEIPRAKIDVVHPGLNLRGHGTAPAREAGTPFTIGYFARICPEKGLHILVEAFRALKQTPGAPPCRLRVSGWLGGHQRGFFEEQVRKLRAWGLAGDFEHVESPDHAAKVKFLQSLDVLSVPTTYRECKGLYVLEALANGVPVVQPRHGSFPELLQATGGGVLVPPGDAAALAGALRELMDNPEQARRLGRHGQRMVQQDFHAEAMAEKTITIYRKRLS